MIKSYFGNYFLIYSQTTKIKYNKKNKKTISTMDKIFNKYKYKNNEEEK